MTTEEGKIADLWSTRTELEYQQKKIERELVVYGRMFEQLMDAEADENDGGVRQSLLDWTATATANRETEVELLVKAIEKIKERMNRRLKPEEEADDARNV